MQQTNQDFIRELALEDIPWNRLATPFYRAAEIPQWLEAVTDDDPLVADEAVNMLAINLEYESVLWQASPFIMIFLARFMGCAVDSYLETKSDADVALIFNLLDLYAPAFDAVDGISDGDHPIPLPCFADLLKPENLMPPETGDEDEEALLRAFYNDISEELFYSFFHYTWMILAQSLKEDVSRLKNSLPELDEAAKCFLDEPLYATLQKVVAA